MGYQEDLNALVAKAVKESPLTMRTIATATGISNTQVHLFLKEKSSASIQLCLKLLDFFGYKVDYKLKVTRISPSPADRIHNPPRGRKLGSPNARPYPPRRAKGVHRRKP